MSLQDYKRYEREIRKRTIELKNAYEKGEICKTICYLKFLTNLYYQINYKMTENIFEDITQKVSRDLLGCTVIEANSENTILFYDGFGLAARGLANIYVRALENLGYDVVWVLYGYAKDAEIIKEKYQNRKNISFKLIPRMPILERMEFLQKLIKEISPRKILIYTTPDDVAGIGVMSTIKGNVTRYLIDLTDHAYWLGRCAFDYVIGFRNNGCNVAVQHREIAPEKVLMLPYYPEERTEYAFAGMPFDVEKYSFVFSGGSVYKIEGDNTYEEIVVNILEKYPQLCFVYAANDKSPKLDLIKQRYPERFFQIPERNDLGQIMKRAKFYLGTYPVAGGLMIQYSLQNDCIALQLCNDRGGLEDPSTLLLKPEKINCVFDNAEELLGTVDKLMNDEEYYKAVKKELSGQIISKEDFERQLELLLSENRTDYKVYEENVNLEILTQSYKKRASYEQYCNFIYASCNKWIWRKHPLIVYKKKREKRKG